VTFESAPAVTFDSQRSDGCRVAELTLDLRKVPKAIAYDELEAQLSAVLEGLADEIAGMATLSAIVHHAFGHLWTGFYRVVEPALLRVGPYQGTLGCLDIQFGKGVCGTAAAERRTIIVQDVSSFPGHITCDPRSRSEIVVPVFDATKALIAVLDIDSSRLAAFDEEDRTGLERLVRWFARGANLSLR
jgi:L-methionine (R)-S-oxide reductase